MPVKTGEYKGHPTISLLKDETDMRPFTFGMGKARLILENIEAIKKFVENNDKGSSNSETEAE
jgi:hypothetical protein